MEIPESPSTETVTAETATAETVSARPAPGRMLAVIIVSALLGAVVGGGVVFLAVVRPSASDRPPASAPPAGSSPIVGIPVTPQGGAASETASTLASAKRLAAAGRLREARDEYLMVLLMEPTHKDAMAGLVRVVGLMAKGNRALLRGEAEEYLKAIATGGETEEHYTAPAMEILARALLIAAGERVPPPPSAARPESPQPAPARTSQRPREERPAEPRVRPRLRTEPVASEPKREPAESKSAAASPGTSAPAAAPQAPAPLPAAPPSPAAPPPPAGPLNADEPFVTVVIGPVGTSDQASAITGELTIAGFAARLRREAAGSYVITVGPIRQSEAAKAARYVKNRFGGNLPVALSPAP